MVKTYKEKRYLLKMPNGMYVQVERYARKNDLDAAKTIRKAIRRLLKIK